VWVIMQKIMGEGSYPGRVVGVGRTASGKPLAVYAVSGRSEMSKLRKAVIVGNSIQIVPLGELTPEQEASKDLIIYRAISIDTENQTLIVSNGKQTDPAYNLICHYGLDLYNAAYATMYTMGFEPDRYMTPRLLGAVLPHPNMRRLLSMVVSDRTQPEGKRADVVLLDAGLPAEVSFITTYTGDLNNPQSPALDRHADWIHSAKVDGNSAGEIAQELYNAMDEKLRVTAVAAMLEDEGWMMDVCNLYA